MYWNTYPTLCVALFFACAGTLAAPGAIAATYSTNGAAAHVGEAATVSGTVVNVFRSRKGNVF